MISALTRVGNRVLALSVPGAAQGEFYRVFTRLGETRKTLVIPAAMRWMTAATNRRLVIVSQASVESKAPHVGPRLALFRVRVLGEFIDQSEDTLIPLTWVEQAVNRARELMHEEPRHARRRLLPRCGVLCTSSDGSDYI